MEGHDLPWPSPKSSRKKTFKLDDGLLLQLERELSKEDVQPAGGLVFPSTLSSTEDFPLVKTQSSDLLKESSLPASYIMLFLLEHLTMIYEEDNQKRRELFETICQHLAQQKFLPPLVDLESLCPVGKLYQKAFKQLVAKTVHTLRAKWDFRRSLSLQGIQSQQQAASCVVPARWPLHKFDMLRLLPSRYTEEFVELSSLGRGGFGKVFKAKNVLDGREYAVKQVHLKDVTPKLLKVLREVKIAAQLEHPNIVRFHAAWLELRPHCSRGGQPYVNPVDVESGESGIVFANTTDNRMEGRIVQTIGETSASTASTQFSIKSTNKSTNNPNLCPMNKHLTASELARSSTLACGIVHRSHHGCFVKEVSAGFSAGSEFVSERNTPGDSWNTSASESARSENERSDDHSHESANPVRLTLFIQMQLCLFSLADWLVERNKLLADSPDLPVKTVVDEGESTRLFAEIASGVRYIHSQGLMHRDLKPGNIFLYGTRRQVKIGDFGLARDVVLEEDSDAERVPLTPVQECASHLCRGSSSSSSVSSEPTSYIGTSTYASPEQLNGQPYDAKSDMFSLGIILFELFWPFATGMERASCLRDVRRGILPTDMGSLWPKQAEVVLQLTALEPADRLDSYDLEQIICRRQGEKRTGFQLVHHLRNRLRREEENTAKLVKELCRLRRLVEEKDERIRLLEAENVRIAPSRQ